MDTSSKRRWAGDRGAWKGRAGMAVLAVLAVALGVLFGPRPLAPADHRTGDAALAHKVRDAMGAGFGTSAIAVAEVTRDDVRLAGLGMVGETAVNADTAFEIGSITKALTGMLLADLAADDTVRLESKVGAVSAGPPQEHGAGTASLEALAQHRAGLPRLAGSTPGNLLASLQQQFFGGNPYAGWPPRRILETADDVDPADEGEFAYSNFGVALLGTSLADARQRSYADLLEARLLRPLGMTSTTVVADRASLPPDRADGTTAVGAPRGPWIGAGYAPAGIGVWSNARDLATVLQAVVRGTAPGTDAAVPRTDIADDRRIGLGWFTDEIDGRQITWHNGGTGGFSSWMGFDRAAQRGIVVLSASDRRVDQLGLHLLDAAPPPTAQAYEVPDPIGLTMVALLLLAVWTIWSAARRARRGHLQDRLTAARALGEGVLLLTATWLLGPWTQVPWWLWSVAAAAAIVGIVELAVRMRPLPTVAATSSRIRVLGGSAHVAVTVALVVWIVV